MTDIKTAKFEKMIHSKVTPKPREGKKAPQSPPSDAEDATAGAHGGKGTGLQSLSGSGSLALGSHEGPFVVLAAPLRIRINVVQAEDKVKLNFNSLRYRRATQLQLTCVSLPGFRVPLPVPLQL